jgi:DNA-binding Lrp family transcriptional regulator
MEMKLDEKDLKLLDELQKNCKQNLKKLARKLDMSITTVHERMKKLEREGVIKGYKAIIDPEKTDNSFTAFILIQLDSHLINELGLTHREIVRKLTKIPHVLEVYVIAGEWDVILKVRGKDVKQISDLVVTKVREMKGILRTHSIPVWEKFKESTELVLSQKV